MGYPRNIYNEAAILGMPCSNFVGSLNIKKNFFTNYAMPFSNIDCTISQNICGLYIYLYRQYITLKKCEIFKNKQMLDFWFEERLNLVFNKIKYYVQFFKAYRIQKLRLNEKTLQNLENLIENSLVSLLTVQEYYKQDEIHFVYKQKSSAYRMQLLLTRIP